MLVVAGVSEDERSTSAEHGLTAAEVDERISRGDVNDVPAAPSWTTARSSAPTCSPASTPDRLVVRDCRGIAGSRDALFGGVIVANTLIGIVQELRAKRMLDSLAIVSAPKVTAVRDGAVTPCPSTSSCSTTSSTCAPASRSWPTRSVLAATNLEIDESLLTGEADPVVKAPGDEVLSGSAVVAGTGRAQVTKVGADTYGGQAGRGGAALHARHPSCATTINRIVTWSPG